MQSQIFLGFCVALMLSLAVGIESFAQEARVTRPARPVGSIPVLTACTQDGEFYLVATSDGRIKFVRLEHGSMVRTIYHCNPTGAVFSPDGRFIATAGLANGRPSKLKIWKVADGAFVREIETEVQGDVRLSFSPDGKYLASTDAQSRIHLWEVETGSLKQSLQANMEVARLFFSKQGQIVVAVHRDGSARLFPVEKEEFSGEK